MPSGGYYVEERVVGWPFSSLRGWWASLPDGSIRSDALWGKGLPEIKDRPLLFPLRPVWPGFAVNALFYAAILWLLWSAPFAARRLVRRRRGRCIACGYDLRASAHDACPECGRRNSK
jgi:hypothetical protein